MPQYDKQVLQNEKKKKKKLKGSQPKDTDFKIQPKHLTLVILS